MARKKWKINVGEDVKTLEPWFIAGRSTNGADILENSLVIYQRRFDIKLPYDPTIPLLDVSQKELKVQT